MTLTTTMTTRRIWEKGATMHKCLICGADAKDAVSSYNHHSWLCDEHVETFVLFAIHWQYKEHAPVPYGVDVVTEPTMVVEPIKELVLTPTNTTPEIIAYTGNASVAGKENYDNVLYNPEARGFARPRGKHLKVYPRWTGMQPKDYQENGPVMSIEGVPAGITPVQTGKKIADTDYASKAIVWDSSNIYTKS